MYYVWVTIEKVQCLNLLVTSAILIYIVLIKKALFTLSLYENLKIDIIHEFNSYILFINLSSTLYTAVYNRNNACIIYNFSIIDHN